MRIFIIFLTSSSFFLFSAYSQNDSIQKTKATDIFGSLYPSFSSTYSNKHKPWYGFEVHVAQIGVHTKIKKNIQGIVLYNVTKTTGDITVLDTSNQLLFVNYFKGSDYTAFLKQAEIMWIPSNKVEFSIGQILSEQYLTVQDKFWGYRYVAFTMQEIYKFGHPADFGFRFAFRTKKIRLSTTISNGEGPFYKQDKNGLLQYAANIEYRPNNLFLIKLYSNVYHNENNYRWCYNIFTGYKSEKYMLGIEGSLILNDHWQNHHDYSGISCFGSYRIKQHWSLFFREDFTFKNVNLKDASYSIVGLEYKFDENFKVSFNQRLLKQINLYMWQSFLSVGLKF